MIAMADFYTLLENAETVEEEVFDVRFEEVVSFVDQEKLDEAATLISDILKEGIVDIRLVMYQFYSQFISQGIISIDEIFPAIIKMISEFREKLSPVKMREKHLLSSLTWFLSSIGKKLKRTEKLLKDKKPDEFLNKSLSSLSSLDIDRIIQTTKELAAFLVQKMEQPTLNQYIMYIVKWLEGIKNLSQNESKEEKKTPPPATSMQKTEEKKKVTLQEVLTSSEPMMHLYRKIEAFEELIEKQDFPKAALVSDDIAQIIKNFDPSVFFPSMFSHYFSLMAKNIDLLAQEWENKESIKWNALNRLYQTDLEEFIKW